MRCLTLADALRVLGAECIFLCRRLPDALASLVRGRGHELRNFTAEQVTAGADQDAEESARLLQEPIHWLIVDHYSLGAKWESALRARARRILAIDDLADRPHECDLLLDQNFYVDLDARYDGRLPPRCRSLLGPSYALLRSEFRSARSRARVREGEPRRLQIFFGGMDAADCTTAALEALSRIAHASLAVDVVIGANHANREHITRACATNGYTLHVQTASMAELMRSADVALGAGGSASWERCCVGLPALLVAVADNQKALVRDSGQAGFAFAPATRAPDANFFATHLTSLLAEPARLSAMSKRGMELVDGRGVDRVVLAMGLSAVRMRPASVSDSRQVFEWRNHPDIRRISRNETAIPWSRHEAWFNEVLTDPARYLLVGEASGLAVGVVRFDIEGDSAEVSIYKVPGYSGTASGSELLVAAEAWLGEQRLQVGILTATVLQPNAASHRLFGSNGYLRNGNIYMKRTFG